MKPARFAATVLVLASLDASPARSKTVVCVDSAPDLSSYEGFISSQLTVPPDVVKVGGSLADCLGMLVKGDELVIIAHGYADPGPPHKLGFVWGGTQYSGFGSGPGQYPVPAGFAALNHITVTVGSCWSARDPDGTGPLIPVTESLKNAMQQGAGNTVSGFTGAATNNTCVDVGNPDRNSAAQIQAAKDSLGAHQNYWRNRAPAGNKRQPPPTDDEQKRAKHYVDSVFVGKDIPVKIRYTPVRDTNADPFANQAPQLAYTPVRDRHADPFANQAPPFVVAMDDTAHCPSSALYFTTGGLPPIPVASPLTVVATAVVLAGTGLWFHRKRIESRRGPAG